MWETVVFVASQVVVQIATWPLAIALLVRLARRAPRWPRVLPALAIVVLLAGTALGSIAPHLPLVPGAAWWIALPLVLGTYPDGRVVPRWIAVPVALYVGYGIAYLVTAGAVSAEWGGVIGFSSLVLLAAPVYRYARRSTSEERESVRWAILAVLVGISCFVVIMIVEGGTVAEHGPVSVAAANVVGAIIPVGLAVGLLRPRLIDVDRALVGTVFAILSVALIAGAGTLAWLATAALSHEARTALVAGAAALAAVPAALLARWASRRLVFPGRLDEDAAARMLDSRLTAIGDASDAPPVVLDTIVDALRLSGAQLSGDAHLAARVGEVSEESPRIGVEYEGEPLAELRASPRPGESALTAYDLRVLRRLAAHAAPALHAARSVAELRQAHAATLSAREEERRRLRRDLHDDLSPTLAGLALSAAAMSRQARNGNDVAAAADEFTSDVKSAIAQVRELAYGLRPPVLDLGLVEALRNRVHGSRADGLDVRVEGDGVPGELPAAVDVAVLRIVQEAVENARKHAGARVCDVRVAVDHGMLAVSVEDDGRGFPAGRHHGIGLDSIRDRAGELGGSVEFTRSPLGGAAVRVRLPLGVVAA